MSDSSQRERQSRPGVWVGLAILFVALAWGLSWFFLYSDPDRGTFGDMFGAVNALFSGLAFAGVIIAILLQREELQLQREELRQTHQELARSASAQESSSVAMSRELEVLQLTARLNACSAMINYYSQEKGIMYTPKDVSKHQQPYVEELRETLDRLRQLR